MAEKPGEGVVRRRHPSRRGGVGWGRISSLFVAAVGLALIALGIVAPAASANPSSNGSTDGTITVHVKQSSLDQYGGCVDTAGAYFVINQITEPPDTISVELSDSSWVTATKVVDNKSTAHYEVALTGNLYVTDAAASVPSGWSGQFVLSHCLSGSPSTGTSSSSTTGTTTSTSPALKEAVPTRPGVTTATCEQPDIWVDPNKDEGVVWSSSTGSWELAPGESLTAVASAQPGYEIQAGAQTEWPFTNGFNVNSCVTTSTTPTTTSTSTVPSGTASAQGSCFGYVPPEYSFLKIRGSFTHLAVNTWYVGVVTAPATSQVGHLYVEVFGQSDASGNLSLAGGELSTYGPFRAGTGATFALYLQGADGQPTGDALLTQSIDVESGDCTPVTTTTTTPAVPQPKVSPTATCVSGSGYLVKVEVDWVPNSTPLVASDLQGNNYAGPDGTDANGQIFWSFDVPSARVLELRSLYTEVGVRVEFTPNYPSCAPKTTGSTHVTTPPPPPSTSSSVSITLIPPTEATSAAPSSSTRHHQVSSVVSSTTPPPATAPSFNGGSGKTSDGVSTSLIGRYGLPLGIALLVLGGIWFLLSLEPKGSGHVS